MSKEAKTAGAQINPFAQPAVSADIEAQGIVQDVQLRRVDPATCRMWAKHNRIYDLLNAENCADLIASIRVQGKQEIPALVRQLTNDPGDFEYEVISGARRHFAVSHLRNQEKRADIFYLIEIRDLQDEEAFRFADLENRGRQDISDYERGREYLQALTDYYGDNLTSMAKRMEVSKSLLSSYMSIAKLPQEVLDAYGDPRQIAVRHGQQLSPLLKGESRDLVIGRAVEISKAQTKAQELGGSLLMGGAEVFKLLKSAGKPTAPRAKKEVSEGAGGVPFLTARIEKESLLLDIDLSVRPSSDELAKAVVRAYERLGQPKSR